MVRPICLLCKTPVTFTDDYVSISKGWIHSICFDDELYELIKKSKKKLKRRYTKINPVETIKVPTVIKFKRKDGSIAELKATRIERKTSSKHRKVKA